MPLVSFDFESVSGIYSTGRGKTADPKGAVRRRAGLQAWPPAGLERNAPKPPRIGIFVMANTVAAWGRR